jgi:hypothetical protein
MDPSLTVTQLSQNPSSTQVATVATVPSIGPNEVEVFDVAICSSETTESAKVLTALAEHMPRDRIRTPVPKIWCKEFASDDERTEFNGLIKRTLLTKYEITVLR